MPLGPDVKKNIAELVADNEKPGTLRGDQGKKRPKDQIIAIAFDAARRNKKKSS